MELKTFNQLKKNLKRDFSDLKSLKVALLGDTATQFLSVALQGFAVDLGCHFKVFEGDFAQINRQILDPSSEYYEFQPDVTIVFESSHKLLANYYKSGDGSNFAQKKLASAELLYENVTRLTQSKFIYCNFPEIDNQVFGNFAHKVESSFVYQLQKLNFLLSDFAVRKDNFYIQDLVSIQSKYGRDFLFSPSIYINTEMVISVDALPIIAQSLSSQIVSMYGSFKKCVILDLDNTTWGGVIGDDGVEKIQIGSLGIGKAFTEFQYWVKALQKRGVIVAVCSKNDEEKAKEPFEKHPDMVLKLDDVAVFVANWENKADNIRKIQKILNIGFDSMVFLDDNPFERNLVRENLPSVCVPELPEDPANYLEYLYSLNLFETASYSENDSERTKQYQVEAERNFSQENFTNLGDFLKSLSMVSDVQAFNSFNKPRVSQLSQRSNQFNLRTIRYSEQDVEMRSASDRYHTLSFTLDDKFGNNGLIAVVVLEKKDPQTLFIENWLMSCRVLKRGMEDFTLNTIVDIARQNGFKNVIGEFIPSGKNQMVEGHYNNLGFEKNGDTWKVDVESYKPREVHIYKN